MGIASKSVGRWVADFITAIVIVVLVVHVWSRSVDSETLRWPAIYGNMLVIAATFLVAVISFRSETTGDGAETQIATALFTFANSVAALVPLLVELFKSNPTNLSVGLQESVVYELLNQSGRSELSVYGVVIALVLLAFWFAWYAAGKISQRVGVEWFASTASILILSVQLLLTSEWKTSTFNADPSAVFLLLILLLIVFSGVVASLVQRVPLAASAALSLVRGGLANFLSETWSLVRSLSLRLLWLLAVAPLYLLFELVIIPAGIGAADVLQQALNALVVWTVVAFLLLAVVGCVLLVLSWAWSAVGRIPEALRTVPASSRLLLRNASIVAMVIAICLIFWPNATHESVSDREHIESDDDLVAEDAQSHSVPTPDWEEAAPELERFIVQDIGLVCDGNLLGFGWKYASTTELSMSLYSCRLASEASQRANSTILVVASASKENVSGPENLRALERGRVLAEWIRTLRSQVSDDPDIYVLNLGMSLIGEAGLPADRQLARKQRPLVIRSLSPYPAEAEYASSEVEDAIAAQILKDFDARDFSLCDLYILRSADVSPELEPVTHQVCNPTRSTE